ALLRALGATRGQVARLLLREAALLGGAGAALGIGLGWALALGMRQVMGHVMTLTPPPLQWSWGPALLGLALGPGMGLAAAHLRCWPGARGGGRPWKICSSAARPPPNRSAAGRATSAWRCWRPSSCSC